VHHCGVDSLTELAETMQEFEDWDDLQAAESEACGVLNDMFGQVYGVSAVNAVLYMMSML